MKKIILGLFLILGAFSFAVPKNLDIVKANKAGYDVLREREDDIVLGKFTDTEGTTVGIIFGFNDISAKDSFESLKASSPETLKLVSITETQKTYIAKYVYITEDAYFYALSPKNLKFKNVYFSVVSTTNKNLDGDNLNRTADAYINEVESFLK